MPSFIPSVNSSIDMEEGIRCTGNQPALYLRFLKRFPEDPSFIALCIALEEKRLQDAFCYAHTLKGLTAQLGITALYYSASDLCELLRTGDMQALPKAIALLQTMTVQYETIVSQIAALP